jgi:hypothetical protein
VDKSVDTQADSKDRAKFLGFAKKLESPVFVKNLGLMFDALEELSDLSLALQKSNITLSSAKKHISRQIEVFLARRDSDSFYYSEACNGVAKGVFKNVVLSSVASKEREINKGQFYQALANSMRARLMPESDKPLFDSVGALDSSTWPSESLPQEFGEKE